MRNQRIANRVFVVSDANCFGVGGECQRTAPFGFRQRAIGLLHGDAKLRRAGGKSRLIHECHIHDTYQDGIWIQQTFQRSGGLGNECPDSFGNRRAALVHFLLLGGLAARLDALGENLGIGTNFRREILEFRWVRKERERFVPILSGRKLSCLLQPLLSLPLFLLAATFLQLDGLQILFNAFFEGRDLRRQVVGNAGQTRALGKYAPRFRPALPFDGRSESIEPCPGFRQFALQAALIGNALRKGRFLLRHFLRPMGKRRSLPEQLFGGVPLAFTD